MLDRELTERVCSINNYLDSARTPHLTNLLDWEDLARAVRDVADVDDLRLRSNVLLDAGSQIIEARRRNRKRDLLQDDAVPALALLPGCDHSRIVLVCRKHFVTALQFHSKLNDFERLACVAGDSNLLWIAAKRFGESAPNRFHTR